jgi:hypothetical protein
VSSIGKAELFAGIFEPYTAAKPKCMAPSQIGIGRYGFYRTVVVVDWCNKNDEIYFNHFLLQQDNKNGVCNTPHHHNTTRTHPPEYKKRTQAVRILEFS